MNSVKERFDEIMSSAGIGIDGKRASETHKTELQLYCIGFYEAMVAISKTNSMNDLEQMDYLTRIKDEARELIRNVLADGVK